MPKSSGPLPNHSKAKARTSDGGTVSSDAGWRGAVSVPGARGLEWVFLEFWIHELVLQHHGMGGENCSEGK